jgi:hypothetical protein
MEANPEVGDAYYQRFDINEDRDLAEIVANDATVTIDEDNFNNLLQIRESSNLEPDSFDDRYYASGIGLLSTEEVNEDGEVEFSSSLDDTYELTASNNIDFETDASGTTLNRGTVINNQYDSLSGLIISTLDSSFGATICGNCEEPGNVLIASDSDGMAGDGTIRFDWTNSVFVDRIELLDIDRLGGSIAAYDDDGELIRSVSSN